MEDSGKKIPAEGLSGLSVEQLRVLATDIRSDILTSVLNNGGHLSSNLGAVELTMGLLRAFDPLKDDLLFDIGHQSYTYKILTGRDLSRLRKTGGEPPFGDRFVSPYEKYENGHAGTAVSVGYGMALAKSLSGDPSYTVALIGDASLVNGLPLETLNLLSTDRKTKFIIVLNDNGMGISPNVGFLARKFQKLRNSRFYFRASSWFGRRMSSSPFRWKVFLRMRDAKDHMRERLIEPTPFEAVGIKYMGPFDGHDFEALDLAFAKAKSFKEGPVVVHVLTKKGFGYPPASADTKGSFHGVKPFFDVPGSIAPAPSFQDLKANYLFGKMKEDAKIVLLTPAMKEGSGLDGLFEAFPKRTLDVGIAEENALVLASGFALKGFRPVIDVYSSFLQRGMDELFEDLSRERIGVTLVDEKAGLANEDGESHHGLYDVAMMKGVPGITLRMPFDRKSFLRIVERYGDFAHGLFVLRLTRDNPFEDESRYEALDGVSWFVRGSAKSLYLATGPLGKKALGLLPRMDKALLTDLLPSKELLLSMGVLSYERIYFYDPYGVFTGTAETLESRLLELHYRGTFRAFTFPLDFYSFGQRDDFLSAARLLPSQVAEEISSEERKATEKEGR